MLIPTLEERIGIFKLNKEGIHANLWQPINKIADIFKGICSFDTDTSMFEAGGFSDVNFHSGESFEI